MNQVTGSDGVGKGIGDIYKGQVTKKQIDFKISAGTERIISSMQLNSNFAVWSGLYLLELYYNKINKLKLKNFIGKPHDIDIYLLGSKETILSTANNIIDRLMALVGDFGNLKLKIKMNRQSHKIDCIRFKFKTYPREINLWFSSVNSVNRLFESFETSNEMIYWASDTQLVISPFAKIAIDSNQILSNSKNSNDISNQKLFELELIGFDILDYIKTIGFISNEIPEIARKESYSKWVKVVNREKNLKKISIEKLNDYIGPSNFTHNKKFTNFTEFELDKYWDNSGINIFYDKHQGSKHSMLILNGYIKEINKSNQNIEILFFISDDETACKVKNMFKSNFVKTNSSTSIIDTNYLTDEEKSSLKVCERFPQYKNENKLGILCNGCYLDEVIDANNNRSIMDSCNVDRKFPGCEKYYLINSEKIPLHTNLNAWVFFGKTSMTINSYIKFITVK